MIHSRISSLEDLAFEGRNKAYGAYDLRRKYIRNLLISVIVGIFIILLLIFIPWFYFYFEPIPLLEGDMMYEVEYYDMSTPPDQETNRLAQALSQPKQEELQAPVVKDSILPKEEKPVETPPEQPKEEEKATVDSSAKPGGSGQGKGTEAEAGPNSAIDVYPRFPGGDEARLYYLRLHVRYPEAAMKNLVQGVVMVVFIVEADGTVSSVEVPKKIGGGCDEEAIRVTKEMPRWEPGKRKGRAVRVIVRMPIVFRMRGHTS